MRKIFLIFALLFSFASLCHADDVSVKGYYRKDGTYVRPHHRSSPDSDLSNNYGRASSQQRKQYQGYTTLPSYSNDYESDGIANRYDSDDDNDGVSDNYDSGQYSTRQNSQKAYQPSYALPDYSYQSQYKSSSYDDNEDGESYSQDSEDSYGDE